MSFTADDLRDLIRKSPSLKPVSKRTYLTDLERYLAFAGPRPAQWTRATTQAFYNGLLEIGLKPQSANRILASLAYAAKWYALRLGDANLDFTKIQLAPDQAPKPRKSLTDAQARALLDTCHIRRPRDLRDFAMLVTLLETGMRRMSIVGMTWDHLPTDPYPAALVPVKRADELYAVPLSDTAVAALAPWRAWCRKHGGDGGGRQGPVFRALSTQNTLSDAALSRVAVYHVVAERAEAARLDGLHPHIFRHTFATWRTAADVPPQVIAAATGHAFNLGALGRYYDRERLGAQARETTPPWLKTYVAAALKGS